MFQTFLGIIILLAPLGLIYCFEDKERGFLRIFTGLAVFHILTAVTFQYFHIFTYWSVLATNLMLLLICLVFFLKYKKKINIKINWLFIFVTLLILFELFSVHFYYKGTVSTINGYQTVSESFYSYPTFSDEWIGAMLSKYSIENHSLPTVNTLYYSKHFKNLLFVFFSVLAQFFLILNLNPVTNYPIMAVVSGFIICFLVFNFLRINKVGNLASSFAMFSVPLIVNGANLPGIWFLIPFISGLIMFLISLSALSLKDKNTFLISTLVSFILYPPIIIFIVPAILFSIFNQKGKKVFIQSVSLLVSLFIAVWLISYLAIGKNGFNFAISQMFRTNLDGGVPSFAIWNVIPFYVLFFVIVGIWDRFKKKDFILLAPIVSGLVFWIFYTTTTKVFLIDYPRVVVITSILLICLAGFGFNFFINKFKIKDDSTESFVLGFIFVIFCLISTIFYPNDSWKKMVLSMNNTGVEVKVSPASPINRYLNPDDLRIFSDIKGKIFMAPPWKGLVIGVATGNYPTESKPSVISNNFLRYDSFVKADCEQKKTMSKKYKVDYVYAKQFNCEGFNFVTSSSEGMFLYKTN